MRQSRLRRRKIKEVHDAIKELNSQIGKGANDWRDRCDQLSAETKLVENALQAQVLDLKDAMQDNERNMD